MYNVHYKVPVANKIQSFYIAKQKKKISNVSHYLGKKYNV